MDRIVVECHHNKSSNFGFELWLLLGMVMFLTCSMAGVDDELRAIKNELHQMNTCHADGGAK